MAGRIMYIEDKSGGICGAVEGAARIGRVSASKAGKTLYYRGQAFRSLKGSGYKANYFEVETGARFWISGCRKDGQDALYPLIIEVDEDVREEYWLTIRNQPGRVRETRFRSSGKHTKSAPADGGRDGSEVPRGSRRGR